MGFINKQTNTIGNIEIIVDNDDIDGDNEVLVNFKKENGKKK